MKIFIGKVIGKKMEKTATVLVDKVTLHPVYGKRVKTGKKYQVHDEIGTEVGQIVRFAASKPYSKTVKWQVLKVAGAKIQVEKNKVAAAVKEVKPKSKKS